MKTSPARFTRREFLGGASALAGALLLRPTGTRAAPAPTGTKPNSVIDGVRIGAISYSYRAERTSAEDVLQALVQNGLSEVELLGPAIQTYAGFSVSSGK